MSAFLVRDSQFLPIWDRKADITYEEILLRRSNWLECPISDPEAVLGHGPCEWPLLADFGRSHPIEPNVRVGSTIEFREE